MLIIHQELPSSDSGTLPRSHLGVHAPAAAATNGLELADCALCLCVSARDLAFRVDMDTLALCSKFDTNMEDHTPPNDSAQEPAAEHTNPSRGKSQTAFSVKPEELNNLGLIFNFTRTECKSWGPPAGEEAQFHSAANNFAEVIRKFLLDERVCFTSEVRHHDKLIPSIKRWFSHAKNNRHTERTFVHSIQLGQLATWTRSGKGGLCQTSYVCLIPHHQRPSSLHVYVVANSMVAPNPGSTRPVVADRKRRRELVVARRRTERTRHSLFHSRTGAALEQFRRWYHVAKRQVAPFQLT
jgi:hypothetical protein